MRKTIPRGAVLVPDEAARVFEGEIYSVYQWTQKLFDGTEGTFEMLRRPDTVTIIGIRGDKIITQSEEQPYFGRRFCVPMGRVDPEDSSWLAAAQRECCEETGLSFRRWRLVCVEQPLVKIEWFNAMFVAWDVESAVDPSPGAGEKITTSLMSVEDLRQELATDFRRASLVAVLSQVNTTEELTRLPEFEGLEVER